MYQERKQKDEKKNGKFGDVCIVKLYLLENRCR